MTFRKRCVPPGVGRGSRPLQYKTGRAWGKLPIEFTGEGEHRNAGPESGSKGVDQGFRGGAWRRWPDFRHTALRSKSNCVEVGAVTEGPF